MSGEIYAQFARRPSEVYQRLAWCAVPVAGVAYVSWSIARLAYVAITSKGAYSWIALPCLLFVSFMVMLIIYGGRIVQRAFVNRRLPLVVLDEIGITLYRTHPVTVPWSELTGASLEQGFKGSTTLLRLDVRDPAVSEAGGSGRVLDLRAMADPPADLLAAIQSRLRRPEGRL